MLEKKKLEEGNCMHGIGSVQLCPLRGVARSGCCKGRCSRRQICPMLDTLITPNNGRLSCNIISTVNRDVAV